MQGEISWRGIMAPSLGKRLEAARRRQFVGRAAECELFRGALEADELPFHILHLYGPGGVGKSSLLREFIRIAAEAGCKSIYLDAQTVEPSPAMFQRALLAAVGAATTQTLQQAITAQPTATVFLVDTFEVLTPLDGWLRDEFLPQLPANVMVVFSSRMTPPIGWRTDPGWQPFVRFIQLRNLAPQESTAYLQRRQIPAHRHQGILDFTHGHPLALALVAELYAQSDVEFQPEAVPNLIATLVERFIAHLPSPAHRAGLEACAMVRLMNEALLSEMLNSDAQPIFEWLRNLSFIEAKPGGILLHDLAREVLATDLRWRNVEQYAALHAAARTAYGKLFAAASLQEQQAILHEYIFLHRDNPAVRPFFEWQEKGTVFADGMKNDEREEILALIEQHEGTASATLAAKWLDHAAQETIVIRNGSGQVEGLLMLIALERTSEADRTADPAVDAAWQLLEHQTPLRKGERATLFRYWLGSEGYQRVSPVQSRLFVAMVQHYLTTPGLAYTLLPCATPDFWTHVFAYADLHRLPAADFVVGERRYGVYGHDWRIMPPLTWLNLLAEREIAMGMAHTMPVIPEALIVLSQTDFTTAVQEALRTLYDANELRTNPLLRSRLVIDQADDSAEGKDEEEERMVALRRLLQETANELQATPRQMKLYRALHHTYFQPAPTQELAAELLDLPFSTYRRHLRAGIDYVAESLWAQELRK